ncbi:MAG: 30S ribosomal protein S18 [Candidatus Omnitrophota bacterium]
MRRIEIKKGKKNLKHFLRKRFCRFCKENIDSVDYKDIKRLEKLITDRGKIISQRSSGNCAKHQRMVARVIKRARFVALLPYTK